MLLEKILAAAALSLALHGTVRAEETLVPEGARDSQATEPLPEEEQNNLFGIEEYARKEVGGLAVKRGYSWTDDKRFAAWAASLHLNGYLAEFRFRKQDTNILREDDEIKIAGITLEGERRYKTYQTDFTFGFEIFETGVRWFNLAFLGQVSGGFQVVKNLIRIEGEDLPGDPAIDFFAAGGGRAEALFHVPRFGGYYVSIGAGNTLEYLFTSNDEFLRQAVQDVQYSIYGILRLSREKERKELRLKKE